jgi:hypothetical protein
MRSRWREDVDAFAFTPTMFPSTRRSTVEEEQAYADLGTALATATAKAKARCAEQHAYADKGSFNDVWDRWKELATPNGEALEAATKTATAWAKSNAADPCVGWRAHALLAHLAEERKDFGAAIAEMDAALAAYPATKYGDPLRQSAYHHLANDRAMELWQRDGYEAAVAWIASRVASDPLMRAFFAGLWIQRLENDAPKREALRQALKPAFQARAERFPEERTNIEWLAGEVDRVLSQ